MTAAAAMTKDELKASLASVGIDPAVKARKDELVALYEEHIASPAAAEKAKENEGLPDGDFSCDGGGEIALANLKKTSSLKGSGRKASKINSDTVAQSPQAEAVSEPVAAPVSAASEMVIGDIDVSQMSDDKLSESLIERGIEVGPIVGTTRNLYRRKLLAALRDESMNGSQLNGSNAAAAAAQNGNGSQPDSSISSLQDGEFSADDEEVAVNGGANGHQEEEEDAQQSAEAAAAAAAAAPETEEESEEDAQPSVVARKTTPSPATKTSPIASLRQRFLGSPSDATDSKVSSGQRFTPTPRRSIHTYKVTEHSTETMVKNKDGTVNYDFDYTKVTSKSDNAAVKTNNRLATLLRILPGFFLVLLGAVLAYYVYTKRK